VHWLQTAVPSRSLTRCQEAHLSCTNMSRLSAELLLGKRLEGNRMEIGNRLNQIFPRSVHCYVLHEQIWLSLRCKRHCFQTANMWKFSAQILTTEAMYSVCVYHSHDPGRSLLSTNVTLVIMSSFTARCHASAVLAMGLYPCLRLCLSVSVCLSQVGILLKRQNVGSHKQHHTIPQGL